jgi:transcriptional regulator with XRE-family HTH domain
MLRKERENMTFAEKLQLIRKNKGLTQEVLAESLHVSRQAVAKWEAGQAYPDIANLIAVSEYFLVTVDYLVKDGGCVKSPPIPGNRDDAALAKFLVTAKQHTYAGKGRETKNSRPNSHDLLYREGGYLYLDTYLGGECFAGEEAVWLAEKPVYAMNYCGQVLSGRFSGDFLKAALYRVPEDKPFRGPEWFQDSGCLYRCSCEGDLRWFQGYEEILAEDTKMYECYFHGGKIA